MELSILSQITLYVLLALIGVFTLIIWGWQINVLRGKALTNPDGSVDSWHEQKTHYGIAFADVFFACPANAIAIILVFVSPRWGTYLLAMAGFWWVWANTMTTSTSLRFEHPKITLAWLIVFPSGILIGLATIVWTVINFDAIYFQ